MNDFLNIGGNGDANVNDMRPVGEAIMGQPSEQPFTGSPAGVQNTPEQYMGVPMDTPVEGQVPDQPFTSDQPPMGQAPVMTQNPMGVEQPMASAPVEQPVTEPISPTQIDSYKPLEVQTQIAEITPGKFDNLAKILDVLVKSKPATISIQNSRITQAESGVIISADVSEIIGQETIFELTDPKKQVPLFKQFKGQNNIFILDDPENARYILTNGPIKLFLPKQMESLTTQAVPPDLSTASVFCTKTISKDVRDSIKNLGKNADSIEYLIQGEQIKAMHIPDTGIYRFEEYITDPAVSSLDETNAEKVLKSDSFLPIDSDMHKITIAKTPDNQFVSVTESNTGLIKVAIFEQLEETTGGAISF